MFCIFCSCLCFPYRTLLLFYVRKVLKKLLVSYNLHEERSWEGSPPVRLEITLRSSFTSPRIVFNSSSQSSNLSEDILTHGHETHYPGRAVRKTWACRRKNNTQRRRQEMWPLLISVVVTVMAGFVAYFVFTRKREVCRRVDSLSLLSDNM